MKYKGGYFPVPPVDHFADLRAEMSRALTDAGLVVERQHHEVGTAGQAEINYRFSTLLQRRRPGDAVQVHHQERRVAATARPRPSCRSRSSATTARACTCHQSLWKDGSPLFYDEVGYAGLSDMARYYIGGLLDARAVAARLHQPDGQLLPPPGAGLRGAGQPGLQPAQPLGLHPHPDHRPVNPKAKRIEFRVPDPSGNPYLAFSAMLMAGLDGIKNKIEPVEPGRQGPLRAAAGRARHASRRCPARWPRCSTRSRPTTTTCTEGGVFTPDLIETWIDYKRTNEIDPIRLRPHPHEFELYYDI